MIHTLLLILLFVSTSSTMARATSQPGTPPVAVTTTVMHVEFRLNPVHNIKTGHNVGELTWDEDHQPWPDCSAEPLNFDAKASPIRIASVSPRKVVLFAGARGMSKGIHPIYRVNCR